MQDSRYVTCVVASVALEGIVSGPLSDGPPYAIRGTTQYSLLTRNSGLQLRMRVALSPDTPHIPINEMRSLHLCWYVAACLIPVCSTGEGLQVYTRVGRGGCGCVRVSRCVLLSAFFSLRCSLCLVLCLFLSAAAAVAAAAGSLLLQLLLFWLLLLLLFLFVGILWNS